MSFPTVSENSSVSYSPVTFDQSATSPNTPIGATDYFQPSTSVSSQSKPQPDKVSLQSKIISRKLKGYLFEDSIREFNPEKLYKTKDSRKREIYKVQGVNILNRDDIDSKTAIERLQKRRAQHNRVERRRRDMINSAIEELSEIIPNAQQDKFARSNVLRLAIEYIRELQAEAHELRSENHTLKSTRAVAPRLDPTKRPPTITVDRTSAQNLPQLQSDASPNISPGWEQEPKSPFEIPYAGNPGKQIHMTSPTGYSGSYFPDKTRHLSLPGQYHSQVHNGVPTATTIPGHPYSQTQSVSVGNIHSIGMGHSQHGNNYHHTRHMSISNGVLAHQGLAPPVTSHSGYHSAPSSPNDSLQHHQHQSYFLQ
ncbi:hypothetical protein K7432_001113 [Basidiobolus ranarum]|uniref:BHLH domain-containing protein n=1 Tax=Basidiobolus ranarum TaxID=34480 RepID=A0ABR2WA58_9FUNG